MAPVTLVFAPARLADALPRLPLFTALATTGRVVIGLFREGLPAFEPTLLRLRKEHAPAALAMPIALAWGGPDGVTAASLRALGAAEAVLLEASLKAVWLARRAGCERLFGYAGGLAGLFLGGRVTRPADFSERPLAAREAELAAALGAPFDAALVRLDVPRGWQAVGRERLDRAKIDPGRPAIGIYAGRAGGDTVDGWPRASFEELIRLLRQRRSDLQMVLLAQLEDLWQAVQLYEKTGKIHPVIGPDLPFTGLLATLTGLDLVIAADSALLQLAGALGVPTLGLYEKDARLRPAAGGGRLFERMPLRSLPPAEVAEAALTLLPASAPRGAWRP